MSLSVELASYFESKLTSRHQHHDSVKVQGYSFENVDVRWDGTNLWCPSHEVTATRERKAREIRDATTTFVSSVWSVMKAFVTLFSSEKETELQVLNSDPSVVDQSIEKKDHETANTADDDMLIGSASIPVYRALSVRAVIFVILDTFGNYGIVYAGFDSALAILIFATIIIYYLICLIVRPKFVNDRYHGGIINSLLGIRCDCPPGRFLRDVSVPVIICSLLFKIAGWLMLSEVIESSDKENLWNCRKGDVCWFDSTSSNTTGKLYHDYVASSGGVDYCAMVLMIELFVVFSTYSDLTTAAQQSVLIQAKRVEKFHHPLTEELLTKSEVQYGYVPNMKEHRPLVYAATMCFAIAFSLGTIVPPYQLETIEGKHKELSAQEFFTLLIVVILIIEIIMIVCEVSNSLYATYHTCLCRMHLLSTSLEEILSDAMKFTNEQAGVTSTAISPIPTQNHVTNPLIPKSLDDVNFHSRLHAWFRARQFFMDLVFPLTYALCNLSLFALSMTFIGFTVFSGVSFFQVATEIGVESAVEGQWNLFLFTIWIAAGLLIVISKASSLWVKKESQIRMMKEFLMETKLARQKTHQSDRPTLGRASSLLSNPIASTLGYARTNVEELKAGRWWLHRVKEDTGDNNEIGARDDDDDDGSGGCGLSNFSDGLEAMIGYAENYDKPATVLTIPVTPVLVASTVGYLLSGASAIAFSLLYAKVFG